jgi:hypothetical protein
MTDALVVDVATSDTRVSWMRFVSTSGVVMCVKSDVLVVMELDAANVMSEKSRMYRAGGREADVLRV